MIGHSIDAKFEFPDEDRQDGAELEVRKLLADAAVLACTKRLVRGLGAFAHGAVSIVNLLAVDVEVGVERLGSNAVGVAPSGGIPLVRVFPDPGVGLADSGRREDVVAFGDDVDAVLGGGSEGRGHSYVVADVAHDGVDGRVETECFADEGIQNWEAAEFFVGHRAELAVGRGEVLDLFFVESLTRTKIFNKLENDEGWANTYPTSGFAAKWRRDHEPVAELVCWPAMRSAIMMCAISWSLS